jgi:hypothetical protein
MKSAVRLLLLGLLLAAGLSLVEAMSPAIAPAARAATAPG